MKYLIIGLGNFGSSLAIELTDLGHEVIAIDSNMHQVEHFKDDITATICMDSSDVNALQTLPLADIDVAIVCIGKNFSASIMAIAILKKNRVRKIICRATSIIHEAILQAIGVNEIVFPEKETAVRLAKRLIIKNVLDSYQADETHFILKAYLPAKYNNLSVADIDFPKFKLVFLSTIEIREIENIFGEKVQKTFVLKSKSTHNSILTSSDIIMVYGAKKDLYRFFE